MEQDNEEEDIRRRRQGGMTNQKKNRKLKGQQLRHRVSKESERFEKLEQDGFKNNCRGAEWSEEIGTESCRLVSSRLTERMSEKKRE